MEGYDTSVVVEYESDEEYRRCLLAAFKLKEYCGSLVEKVDALRVATAGTPLHDRTKKFEFEEDLAFFMLFSFDEFKQTHAMLKLMFL
jgi:hypothetical protein